MKKRSKKEMTIEDLAVITAKGFQRVDERFDKVDERFIKVDERFDKVEGRLDKVEGKIDRVEKKILELDDSIKAARKDVLEIGDRFVPRFEFDNLLIRFSRLEQKVKEKLGK